MLSWGRNDSGQLGVADTAPRLTPTRVISSSTFVSVACGSRTTLGVTNSGNILGWGSAVAKVLGEDVEDDAVTIPRALEGLDRIVQVTTRGSHAVALDEQGRVFTWGRGEQDHQNITRPIMLPLRGFRIKLIAAGRMHSVAVDDGGALFTWGSSDEGQTGSGQSAFVPFPIPVLGLPGPVMAVSCGSRHTLLVVAGSEGGVMGFGGNSYSQLGLGDKEPRFTPTKINFIGFQTDGGDMAAGAESQRNKWSVSCGYRHSFIYSEGLLFGFGWNSNHQVSSSPEAVVALPSLIQLDNQETFSMANKLIRQVGGGGRHTLVLLENRVSGEYSLVAFGRSASGELGLFRYVENACREPRLVLTITNSTDVPRVACGWEHTVITTAGGRVNAPSITSHWFSSFKGDFDAALAQFVNCLVLFRLAPTGSRLGVGKTVITSNILFGLWAYSVNATALPHGLNTVALFAIQMGAYEVMMERHPNDQAKALGACFFCTITLGFAQALSAFAVAPLLKKYVPRSALSATVAGVALAFITTKFTGEIFASPRSGLPSWILLLIGFGARQRMPFGIPVAFVALFVGWLVSTPNQAMVAFLDVSDGKNVGEIHLMDVLFESEYYPLLLTVVLPLVVVNIVNDLACIDQARASGDLFIGSNGLLLDSMMTLVGAIVFGNPFPTCIYVGHSSFKAMGATFAYSLLNALLVAALVFKFPTLFVTIVEAIPQVATVGILVWIGSVVTTEAFKTKKHGVAVVVALVPALASWKSQGQSADVGLKALGEGYMLVSMILGAVVAQIIDRRFMEATGWLLFGALVSYLGWIHSSGGPDTAQGYFFSAVVTGLWAFGQWWGGEREADLDDDGGIEGAAGDLTKRPSPEPTSGTTTKYGSVV